jgi:hypothetical protein
VREFAQLYNLDVEALLAYTREQLLAMGIAPVSLDKQINTQAFDAYDVSSLQLQRAVHLNLQRKAANVAAGQNLHDLLHANHDYKPQSTPLLPLFVGVNFPSGPMQDYFQLQCQQPPSRPYLEGSLPSIDEDIDACATKEAVTSMKHSRWPSFMLDKGRGTYSRVVMYQNIGADTGGTIAIDLLADEIMRLGFDVVVCSERNIGTDVRCSNPRGNQCFSPSAEPTIVSVVFMIC